MPIPSYNARVHPTLFRTRAFDEARAEARRVNGNGKKQKGDERGHAEGGGARRGLLERWKLKIQNGRYFRPTGPKQKVARRSLWHASLYARLWFALFRCRTQRGVSVNATGDGRRARCSCMFYMYVFRIVSNNGQRGSRGVLIPRDIDIAYGKDFQNVI